MFKYETSKISWCEDKYIYNNNIVEYWNTFSNIIFIFASIYGIFKIYYDKNDMKYFYNLFLFLGIVGICSTIYHMTLSLFGQLLDEWAICILLISCIWKILKLPIYFLKYFILTLSIAMLLRPEYNHKILMIIGIISSIFLIKSSCTLRRILFACIISNCSKSLIRGSNSLISKIFFTM